MNIPIEVLLSLTPLHSSTYKYNDHMFMFDWMFTPGGPLLITWLPKDSVYNCKTNKYVPLSEWENYV